MLTTSGLVGCASKDDEASTAPTNGKTATGPLKGDWGFQPAEIVFVEDYQVQSDGSAPLPRARVMASNQTGFCEALQAAFEENGDSASLALRADQQLVSFWIDAATFDHAGSYTLDGSTSSAGFFDTKRVCAGDGGKTESGAGGSLEIASVGGDVVKGVVH